VCGARVAAGSGADGRVYSFLGALGSRVADRWLSSVLTPGLLLLTVVALAARLGQAHALDLSRITASADDLAAAVGSRNPAALGLGVLALLAATVALGLLISGLGRLVAAAWTAHGAHVPGRWLIDLRRRRWTAAEARIRAAAQAAARETGRARIGMPDRAAKALAALDSARTRRDAICPAQPQRPFQPGDRLRVATERVRDCYGLDLATAWPRLWTIAAGPLRADLDAAQSSFADATRLAAWACSVCSWAAGGGRPRRSAWPPRSRRASGCAAPRTYWRTCSKQRWICTGVTWPCGSVWPPGRVRLAPRWARPSRPCCAGIAAQRTRGLGEVTSRGRTRRCAAPVARTGGLGA
jgi:hypothetical protein